MLPKVKLEQQKILSRENLTPHTHNNDNVTIALDGYIITASFQMDTL